MFKWASKQKDKKKERQSLSKQSQPSSPAHSTTTFKSLKSQTSHRKITLKKPSNIFHKYPSSYLQNNTSQSTAAKIQRQSEQKYNQSPIINNNNNMTPIKYQKSSSQIDFNRQNMYQRDNNTRVIQSNKKQLSQFVNNKLNKYKNPVKQKCYDLYHHQQANRHTNGLHNQSQRKSLANKKIVIKLMVHTNLMLSQFLMNYYDIREKSWNPYSFASIMLKMGFITDLVNDRFLVKQLWDELERPDILGLYAYLEKIMGNRVDVSEAEKAINEATSNKIILSPTMAHIIIQTDRANSHITQLKNRRINRKEGIHL